MEYKERIPAEEAKWIQARIIARNEKQHDWATYIGMSKSFFSKVLHQVRPLPDKYTYKWDIMENVIKGDEPFEGL